MKLKQTKTDIICHFTPNEKTTDQNRMKQKFNTARITGKTTYR